jgi:hypothetical protein
MRSAQAEIEGVVVGARVETCAGTEERGLTPAGPSSCGTAGAFVVVDRGTSSFRAAIHLVAAVIPTK